VKESAGEGPGRREDGQLEKIGVIFLSTHMVKFIR
jgi:hypothetical protein